MLCELSEIQNPNQIRLQEILVMQINRNVKYEREKLSKIMLSVIRLLIGPSIFVGMSVGMLVKFRMCAIDSL